MSDNSIISNLNRASNAISRSFEKLSSGKRINRASDDAAGLAIVAALDAAVKTTTQASRNIDYGSSALQIADSALGQLSNIASRQAELATQAANGTLNDTQRQQLDEEYQALTQESQRITSTTQFNGISLFNSGQISIQAGTDGSSSSQLSVNFQDVQGVVDNRSSTSIGSQANAQAALDSTNSYISQLAQSRGEIGAVDSRLSSASENLDSQKVEYSRSKSRIEDVDVAEEVANKTAGSIRQQASVAILAQANVSKESVLRLLS